MSHDSSPHDSQSESSGSSPNAVYMLRSDKESSDLILFGQLVAKHQRSATVRRASASASLRNKVDSFAKSQDDMNVPIYPPPERGYRRSLDSTYRQSLESISEYNTKNSFSTASLGPSPYRDILDSTCSDSTDYATRSMPADVKDERKTQGSSSYLSWFEGVKVKHNSSSSAAIGVDVDAKVGEWNNFWLNYNNPNNRYTSNQNVRTSSTEIRTADDVSDIKSTSSTQRDFNEKLAKEHVILTVEEIQEALVCSQRLVDILQKALKRCDNDTELLFFDRSRQDSSFSQQTISLNEESYRDCSFSYVEQLNTARPSLKSQPSTQQPPQPTSKSCINAFLNTGVADILKRVINKRKDILSSEDPQKTPRCSFSNTK